MRLGSPLDGTGSYAHWGVVQISWANLIVILLMLLVFVLALLIPFAGSKRSHGRRRR